MNTKAYVMALRPLLKLSRQERPLMVTAPQPSMALDMDSHGKPLIRLNQQKCQIT
jgi:hypothetical protein